MAPGFKVVIGNAEGDDDEDDDAKSNLPAGVNLLNLFGLSGSNNNKYLELSPSESGVVLEVM